MSTSATRYRTARSRWRSPYDSGLLTVRSPTPTSSPRETPPWLPPRRSGRRSAAESERHGRRRRLALRCGVELAGLDPGDAGEEHPRDRAHQTVEFRDRVVVVLASERDLVLGVGQIGLQLLEICRCLEIGIGLG